MNRTAWGRLVGLGALVVAATVGAVSSQIGVPEPGMPVILAAWPRALPGPAIPVGTHASIAAVDLATGRSYASPAVPVHTASVVKLDILETLLLQGQDAHRGLDAPTRADATRMIENSDNDAATRLWRLAGGAPGVAAANVRFGLAGTHLDAAHWGLSTTTAPDQIRLLTALVRPGPLAGPAQQYALGLMSAVEPDQRWGVSAAFPSARTALKNGWLPLDADGGRWVVSSVGISWVDGGPVLLAVLTEHQVSEPDGIARVQALAGMLGRTVVPDGGPHVPPSTAP